jgi:hypothetical protein
MSELGGLPKLPTICSQCGQDWCERACGPTHAIIWHAIEAPVEAALVAGVRAERAVSGEAEPR